MRCGPGGGGNRFVPAALLGVEAPERLERGKVGRRQAEHPLVGRDGAAAVFELLLEDLGVAVGERDDLLGVARERGLAVVELEGLIAETEDLVRELRQHRENPSVRAVVIRINSPGGVVGPTQEVYNALLRVREAGKPVVASLGAVAASGGYYAAVAADQIYANPGTLTGSIGVIMQLANVDMLLKKVGVDFVVVKAGEFKDIGNPARPMTAEERRVVQALLEDVHAQFIEAVAQGRKLDRSAVVRRHSLI